MTTITPIENFIETQRSTIYSNDLPIEVLRQKSQLRVQRMQLTIQRGIIYALMLFLAGCAIWMAIQTATEKPNETLASIQQCHALNSDDSQFDYMWSVRGCEAISK